MAERRIAGWIEGANTWLAVFYIARLVGYDFDDCDWQAIALGLEGTDADADRWFDYPLVGKMPVQLLLARHVDAEPVMVTVLGNLDDVLAARIETALDIY